MVEKGNGGPLGGGERGLVAFAGLQRGQFGDVLETGGVDAAGNGQGREFGGEDGFVPLGQQAGRVADGLFLLAQILALDDLLGQAERSLILALGRFEVKPGPQDVQADV